MAEGFFLAAEDAGAGAVFFAAATAFFAACLATDFFFATGALTAASADLTPLLSTKNESRFFANAIHPGARPNPDQVLPVFGSAYFAALLLVRLVVVGFLPTMAFLTADAFFDTAEERCSSVTPS